MDVKQIEKHLKVENLEAHIVDLIKKSKIEAEREADIVIQKILAKIDEFKSNAGLLSVGIISDLVYVKKIIYNNEITNFNFYIHNFKGGFSNIYNTENSNDYNNELAKFIIKTIGSFEINWLVSIGKFEKLKIEIPSYYLTESFLNRLPDLFLTLNKLNLIKDFTWDINSIDEGITSLFKELVINYDVQIRDLESKLKFEKERLNFKISSLQDKIESNDKNFIREIDAKEYVINFHRDYIKKYLENQPIPIFETYFGDNDLFLMNVYKFLVKNQLLKETSWSYFYWRSIIGDDQIINLTSKGNLKFIGRVFYNLQDFLLPKYKNDFYEFLMNKFYVNEKPINQNFFKNHMRPIFDETLYPDLLKVDTFFEKQKDIYMKTE